MAVELEVNYKESNIFMKPLDGSSVPKPMNLGKDVTDHKKYPRVEFVHATTKKLYNESRVFP